MGLWFLWCYVPKAPLALFAMLSRLPCGHMKGKGLTAWLYLWCLLWFCYFPIWYPGTGVVLDCIDSWSLLSFFDFLCGYFWGSSLNWNTFVGHVKVFIKIKVLKWNNVLGYAKIQFFFIYLSLLLLFFFLGGGGVCRIVYAWFFFFFWGGV